VWAAIFESRAYSRLLYSECRDAVLSLQVGTVRAPTCYYLLKIEMRSYGLWLVQCRLPFWDAVLWLTGWYSVGSHLLLYFVLWFMGSQLLSAIWQLKSYSISFDFLLLWGRLLDSANHSMCFIAVHSPRAISPREPELSFVRCCRCTNMKS
jgi:hypothetical protein